MAVKETGASAGRRILLLDGGMGTTLEATGADISSSLWGSELVVSDPSVIAAVHRAFVDAGADIIETATYQMSGTTFAAAGQEASARPTMHAAVSLAVSVAGKAAVALSVGPYGATLRPGQEYAGFYGPPYGPAAFSPDGDNTNVFPDDAAGEALERAAEDVLTAFHLDRLRVNAAGIDWARVRFVAFETVPVLREIRAVRRAVAALAAGATAHERKAFWITSAFPDGAHGQQLRAGGHARVDAVVAAMLDGDGARPDYIGVNCTNPGYLGLVEELTAAVSRRPHARGVGLVLYPDGGEVYDVQKRAWSGVKMGADEWADRVMAVVRKAEAVEADGERVWNGIIVGGCCKAGPEEIAALRRAIDRI
ncbi:AdoMet-homocysteine methyltransferase [Cryptotrichosporon argae]